MFIHIVTCLVYRHDGVAEPQQADRYRPFLSQKIEASSKRLFNSAPPRKLRWENVASGAVQKLSYPGLAFPVTCKNDEVLLVWNSSETGSVQGVELKKRLTLQVGTRLGMCIVRM